MIKAATHIGALIGDARNPGRHAVNLRETNIYWITVPGGIKYRKQEGSQAGSDPWPMYHLVLGSIRPLDAEPTDRRDKS